MMTVIDSLRQSLTQNPVTTQLQKAIQLLEAGYPLNTPIDTEIQDSNIPQQLSIFKDPQLEEKLIDIFECFDDKLGHFLHNLAQGLSVEDAFQEATQNVCEICGNPSDFDICEDCEEEENEVEEEEEEDDDDDSENEENF